MADIKAELTFDGNDILKTKKFRGLELPFRIENNFINLTMLGKFIATKYHISVNVGVFMETKTFYNELMKIDDSISSKGNVYLLQFKEEKMLKIGRTFDPKKRYPFEIMKFMIFHI